MNPTDSPYLESPPPRREEAFWDYQDIFVVIGLLIVTVFALPLLLIVLRHVPTAYLNLIAQAVVYLVALGSIAAILRLRYDRPFWRSLKWIAPRPFNALMSFALGPLLAIGLAYLAHFMGAEQRALPFEKMLTSTTLAILYGIVVVFAGPLCEELVFRGFMMPLLIRSVGTVAGIVVTAVLFGALHALQYPDWRIVLMVAIAGAAFGWRRYATGSTIDSGLMHIGFNLLPFLALFYR
jgi:membrane protease YdiL (CAAX protease family)